MAYTPTYTKPYENGWENLPSQNTPVTAEILNMLDATIEAVEEQLVTEEERVDTLQVLVEGMQNPIVFETYAELETAIADETYTAELKVGQVFLIVETDVPDYWWTGTGLAELEGKVNLSGYVTKEEMPAKVSDLENDAGYITEEDLSGMEIGDGVPTSRKIAGVDLADDITAEELKEALGIYEGMVSVSTDLQWGIANLSADVSVATPIGYVIPFDSCTDNENITFDEENHGFVLRAGRTYELEAFIRFIGSAGYKYFRFYDNVNNVSRGISGGCEVASSSMYVDAITPAKLIVTPEVDTLYTLIVDTASNTTGTATFIQTSYFKVVELLENIFEGKDITTTDSTTLPNSHAGRVLFNSIIGGMEQGENPSTDNPQSINGSVIETVRVHGEQLFDASATPYTQKHDYSFDKESGDYSFTASTAYLMNRWKIKVKPNADITITAKEISANVIVQISNTSLDGTIDARLNSNKLKTTVNTLDFTKLSVSIFVNTDSSGTVEANGIMVSYDADANYEPYQGKEITLSNPITLYSDVLSPQNVERKYKKVVFDGSDDEGWVKGNATAYNRFYIKVPDGKVGGKVLSTQSNNVAISSNLNLYMDNDFTTLEEWLAHLAENPMTVVYELAESVIEELPTADQIALNSLPTFDGVTYVEFVDVGVMPTVSLDYGTSKVGGMTLEGLLAGINGELQSQLNNDRITALESAVVNNV